MKNKNKKYLSTATLCCLLLSTFYGNSLVFASNSNKSYGTTALEKTLNNYENNLKGKSSISTYSRKNSSSNYSSDEKQEILKATISSYDTKEFEVKNEKQHKTILKSMKDENSSSYKFFIKSEKPLPEIKEVFNYFDDVEITLVSDSSDENVYKVLIPYSGKISKVLGSYIEAGTLPTELFSDIEVIQPFIVESTADTDFLSGESITSNWGIEKIGAQDYQKYLSTKDKVTVGVIDTGIYYNHSDLAGNIYTNSGEIAGNGLDDDDNGYIDDLHGFDFIAGDGTAEDDYGHGTHVAGIIGAEVNGSGIFGTDSNVSMVSLKVLDSSGYGSSYSIMEALEYAADNGIDVVNLSLGGEGDPSTDALCSTISEVKSKGVITIVAAGNANSDTSGYIPAGCSDAITVGAVDSSLTKASFSNYGDEIDVSAPGVSIYSTVMSGGYESWNGTSMATPFVTGLVASMKAVDSSLTYDDIKASLIDNGVDVTSSKNIGKFISMSNVMTSLGVSADETTDDSTTENVLPELSLEVVDNGENNYTINVKATDTDGEISEVKGYLNGEEYGTGTTYDVTVTSDSTFKVVATDDDGGYSTQSVSLSYTAPESENVLPELSLELVDNGENSYTINATAIDSDGEISEVKGYLNGEEYGTGTTFDVTVSADSTFKVVATDNDGGEASESVSLSYTETSDSDDTQNVTVSSTLVKDNYYNIVVNIEDDSDIKTVRTYYTDRKYTTRTNFNIRIKKDVTLITKVYYNDGSVEEISTDLEYTNKLPTLNIYTKESSKNKYLIYAKYSDSDGSVENINIYANGELISNNRYTYVTLTEDTVVKVEVTDNDGGMTSKEVTLEYNDSADEAPELTLKSRKLFNRLYLSVNGKDTDGKIVTMDLYLDGELYKTFDVNKSTYYKTLRFGKSGYTVKVILTDDAGNTTEKSIDM